MIVEKNMAVNVTINLRFASVDNHIPKDDIFDYLPLSEYNIYILSPAAMANELTVFVTAIAMVDSIIIRSLSVLFV